MFSILLVPLVFSLPGVSRGEGSGELTVVERRARVLEAGALGQEGMPVLAGSLEDESALVRRAAMRALADLGDIPADILLRAMDNNDPVIRRTALLALSEGDGEEILAHLEKGLADGNALVRETAVKLLIAVEPRTEEITRLLEQAQRDESADVREHAMQALWPFHREVDLLRDRPDMADHVERIIVTEEVPLPKAGWRFKMDRDLEGHIDGWFEPEFDDEAWEKAEIESFWQQGYIGVGWYRLRIDLPERPRHLAAELHFEAVDESTWLWVNGQYAGSDDIGPAGWNVPFAIDVTDFVRWGETNWIVVRAMNTRGAGGIWKPVTFKAKALR